MHEATDPLTMLDIPLVGVHLLNVTWIQVMASCLKQQCPSNETHDLVVEDPLITRYIVAGLDGWQNFCTHQVVLDIDWD